MELVTKYEFRFDFRKLENLIPMCNFKPVKCFITVTTV